MQGHELEEGCPTIGQSHAMLKLLKYEYDCASYLGLLFFSSSTRRFLFQTLYHNISPQRVQKKN